MDNIKKGTVLIAKPEHPERMNGGNGIAVVVHTSEGTNFIVIEWIDSKLNPYAPEDVAALNHLHTWYDIIDDSHRDKFLPINWKPSKTAEGIVNSVSKVPDFQKELDDELAKVGNLKTIPKKL